MQIAIAISVQICREILDLLNTSIVKAVKEGRAISAALCRDGVEHDGVICYCPTILG